MVKINVVSILIIAILSLGFVSGEASARQTGKKTAVGKAGWYAKYDSTDPMPHIRNTDGSLFNENAFTCAMRSRRFGHHYKVTNLKNGKSIIVKHRDFGPATKYRGKRLNRIIDLSKAAFEHIADLKTGVIWVKVKPI